MSESSPPSDRLSARRALLVDDEPVIRVALRRFFQRQGWSVDEAEDGRDALARLLRDEPGATPYDVVICDLRMPGLTGPELFARLGAERPALLDRLIFSTGDAVSHDAATFLERSGRPVLHKPFEFAELRAIVERLVAER